MNYYDLILAKKLGGGGGGSVTINPLSVSANGTYSAPTGTAYSPVTVSVSGGGVDTLAERLNNTLSAYSSNDVTSIPTNAFYNASITEVTFPNVTTVGVAAFSGCTLLKSVSMERVTYISQSAFSNCKVLTNVYMPLLSSISGYVFAGASSLSTIDFPNLSICGIGAFAGCSKLADVSLPTLKEVTNQVFRSCTSLRTLTLPVASLLSASAFAGCTKLESLYLQSTAVCSLAATNTFSSSPIVNSSYLGHFGSVFVPSSLLTSYTTATNWASLSARIVGV